jgi:hypothetical protein
MSLSELAAVLTAPAVAALNLAAAVESVAIVVAAVDIKLMTRHQCRGGLAVTKLVSCTEKKSDSSTIYTTS